MNKDIKIKNCRHCSLRATSMDGMYCGHPHFENKGYDAMIISQSDLNTFPKECPLKKGKLTITYKIN